MDKLMLICINNDDHVATLRKEAGGVAVTISCDGISSILLTLHELKRLRDSLGAKLANGELVNIAEREVDNLETGLSLYREDVDRLRIAIDDADGFRTVFLNSEDVEALANFVNNALVAPVQTDNNPKPQMTFGL